MSRPVRLTGLAVIAVCVGAAAVITCPVAAFGADLQAGAVPVVINEVLASNGHTLADPQGEYDDWIELYNQSSAPVNLGGMYLTDDPAEPAKWQFPKNAPAQTTIPAHGYLLVWADGEVGDSGLHASFNLSASGESVALFDRDGLTLIDSVDFEAQRTDISYGRFPDGAEILVSSDASHAGDTEHPRLPRFRREAAIQPGARLLRGRSPGVHHLSDAGSNDLLHDRWLDAISDCHRRAVRHRRHPLCGARPHHQDHLSAGGGDQRPAGTPRPWKPAPTSS